MKLLKNLAVGFAVSFVGSIPLGYLNVIGYRVREELGVLSLVYYLLGVITVEAFVIYLTLVFAEKLTARKKLLKYIELFSIFFMLLLAYIFYTKATGAKEDSDVSILPAYSPFLIGVVLNCLNFVQLPFWLGWNLYLINAAWISTKASLKYFYVIGTVAGTFFGMFLFVMFLNYVMNKSGSLSEYVLAYIIPLIFIGMAVFQGVRFYQKYYKLKVAKK
jgi:hypothetical protein